MDTPILQNLLKLLISLLLALAPLYTSLAQKTEKKAEPKTMRVKMFKSVDGKLFYSKDTVIKVDDHEQHLKALEGVKFNEKTWKKLDASKVMVDSLKDVTFIRTPEAISFSVTRDSVLHKLKDAKVYKLERKLGENDRAVLFERLKGATGDSFKIQKINENRVIIIKSDSTHNLSFNKISFDGTPGKMFSIAGTGVDSVHVIVREVGPVGAVSRDIEMIHAGDITTRYTTSDKIKIETDESGKTTVYEVDEKGNKKEIDAYHFGKSGEKASVIFLSKTSVTDITKEDKKALKEAGVKVEKSAKKELKIENLSYYPNPNNGRFNVSFSLPEKGAATLRVLDSAGKEVYQEKIDNPTNLYEKQLDIAPFGKGIYYLQVQQGGKILTKRLLVQ